MNTASLLSRARIGLISLALMLGLAFWTPPAQAWDFAGHFIVAAIAQEQLEPGVRAEAERLIKILATAEPATPDFIPASAWLDAQGWNPDFGLTDDWHFIAIPYPPGAQIQRGRVVEVSAMAARTLAGPRSSDFQKALMLRVLMHTVADMHQPLHTIDYHTPEQPGGDRGGRGFGLQGSYPNLHALWDAAGGQYPYLELKDWRRALPLAQELMKEFPARRYSPANPHAFLADFLAEPGRWADESYLIALTTAYGDIKPQTQPDDKYLLAARAASRRQLAMAGYRLAHLLNATLKPDAAVPVMPAPVRPSSGQGRT